MSTDIIVKVDPFGDGLIYVNQGTTAIRMSWTEAEDLAESLRNIVRSGGKLMVPADVGYDTPDHIGVHAWHPDCDESPLCEEYVEDPS